MKWIKCSERLPETGWYPVKIRNERYDKTEIMFISSGKIKRMDWQSLPQDVLEIATKEELVWLDKNDNSDLEKAFNVGAFDNTFSTFESWIKTRK